MKTVGLDREAYDRLRAEKREGESFSDVVKRITGRSRSIMEFAGAWKDLPAEDVREFDEAFRSVREAGRERADRAARLWEEEDAGR